MNYAEFVSSKLASSPPTGIAVDSLPEAGLFPHQRDLTLWALRRGRAAIFADTGLGKTRMEIEWADRVVSHTGRPVLILAPLAVAEQTVGEGETIGIEVTHCMLLPTSKVRNGYIGLYDFRGDLIRAFEKRGFIFHSEVVIWKDPVTAMQRTKALGLLHKTVRENSAMARQGVPDYLVTMRSPGESERITHERESYPVDKWQRIASPIWTDIDPYDTLQYASAREHNDERHIAPLQLEVIRRGVELWTNPGDIVLSPFAGIASEGYVALQMQRRFVGIELKESYYRQAAQNLSNALKDSGDLFASEAA